jgi:hypothetical protein
VVLGLAAMLVINAWLVSFTWLLHMDRPYGPVSKFLHHGVGDTHVCDHISPRIRQVVMANRLMLCRGRAGRGDRRQCLCRSG